MAEHPIQGVRIDGSHIFLFLINFSFRYPRSRGVHLVYYIVIILVEPDQVLHPKTKPAENCFIIIL